MKKKLFNGLAASAFVVASYSTFASEELIIHVSINGEIASGVTVNLDGSEQKQTTKNGAASFDLEGGVHSIQLVQDGKTIHKFRFSSAKGQLTDIAVNLNDDNKDVKVESFFADENGSNRKNGLKGQITGIITANGSPVANASVSIVGTSISVESDSKGRYTLEAPRGVYSLSIAHQDHKAINTDSIRIVSRFAKGLNFSFPTSESAIALDSPQIEEVTVLGSYNPNEFEVSERFSANVIDTMGIEQLARFGDTNISASVVRMPSVTIEEDSFIFIRGLGGRYVTSSLNGATMPSTNPSKRSVPLDLFPSNIVSQLDVKKTFVSSMPGESTGGNLVINTRAFPEEAGGKFSIKTNYTSDLTGETVNVDPLSGDYDYLGWDDGSRDEPVAVSAISLLLDPSLANPKLQGTDLSNNLTAHQERGLRRAAGHFLLDGLDLDQKTAEPDISVSANYGNVYDLEFGESGSELGFFSAFNYKSGWTQRADGIRRTYSQDLQDIEDDFAFSEVSHQINMSGLLSVGFKIGDHEFESNSIVSRVTESNVRQENGFDGDSLEASQRHRIEWIERTYLSQQLAGTHFLNETGDWSTKWQFTASTAQRYSPDRREVVFNQRNPNASFLLEEAELIRRFDDLEDYNFDFSNSFNYTFDLGDAWANNFEFGYQLIHRERDTDSASYGFRHNGNLPQIQEAPNLLASEVINSGTNTGDASSGFAFTTRTLASDSYDSEMDLNSAFLSLDTTYDSLIQVVLGARIEDFSLTTNTFALSGAMEAQQANLDEDILLPSLSTNWFINESSQLRFAVSKTVSRPDFKEASNAVFYDNEFNFRVRGNPNLKISEITNFDLRWETYFSDTESFSIAAFYKDFKDPIERVVLTASGTAGNSRTFENSASAQVRGIELDGRKDFPLNDSLTKSLFITSNASYIESEVEEGSGSRPLQGQPEYTFNFIVGWDDLDSGQELTVLFNQNGNSVVDAGLGGLPSVEREPFADLKINYKKTFENQMGFSAKIGNLLNSDVEFTQGGRVFQSYKRGITFQAGFDWNF